MSTPCRAPSISPLDRLLKWEMELDRAALAVGQFVIEFSHQRYCVRRPTGFDRRRVVFLADNHSEIYSQTLLVEQSAFRSLLNNHPHKDKLPGLDISRPSKDLLRSVLVGRTSSVGR